MAHLTAVDGTSQERKRENEEKAEHTPRKKLCTCKCAIERSCRFAIRVMEAMRSLQRNENFLPMSSFEEIVAYIEENYCYTGDLRAQVQTALKQVCSQGLVVEVIDDEYQLIGPFAKSMQNAATLSDKNRVLENLAEDKESSTGYDCSVCLRKEDLRYRSSRIPMSFTERAMKSCSCDEIDQPFRVPSDVSSNCYPAKTEHKGRICNRESEVKTDLTNKGCQGRNSIRNDELKKWIQRCRRECERRQKH